MIEYELKFSRSKVVRLLQAKKLISSSLLGQYSTFSTYCERSGKLFVNQLTDDDFLSFAATELCAPEEIGRLKFLLNLQAELPAYGLTYSPPAQIFVEREKSKIERFLRKKCSQPLNSQRLFELFLEHFAPFLSRNNILAADQLFALLKAEFRNNFYFARSSISTTPIKDVSSRKTLLNLLEKTTEIEIDDLVSICKERNINYSSKMNLINTLRPSFIRADKYKLRRPETIGVNEETVSEVFNRIQRGITRNGGWLSAKTFDDYEWLPQLNISWNAFLLEGVATLSPKSIVTVRAPAKIVESSLAIFLAAKFAKDNFKSFLLKVVRAEHERHPFSSEKKLLLWLMNRGLCNDKLPKFLDTESLEVSHA